MKPASGRAGKSARVWLFDLDDTLWDVTPVHERAEAELLAWLRSMPSAPQRVFVTHGDPDASDQLRHRIECELKWPALVPEHGSTWPA